MVANPVLGIVIESIIGPTLSSVISKVIAKESMRRKCAIYYTMLIRSPKSFRDEVARMGEAEGCWSSKFVRSLLVAEDLRGFGTEDNMEVSTDRVKSVLEKAVKYSLPIKR